MFVRTSVVNILIVWNWRTGDVVRVDSFLSYPYSEFTFLDEFRLLTSTGLYTMDAHELDLIVFDTSFPQQSRHSWRRFNIAPMHHDRYARSLWAWGAWIYTDGDRSRGEGSRGEPLVVDTTQSVVVLVLYHHECGYIADREVVFVVRAATLVGYMSSTRNDLRIPWDDWKRDDMVVEVQASNQRVTRLIIYINKKSWGWFQLCHTQVRSESTITLVSKRRWNAPPPPNQTMVW